MYYREGRFKYILFVLVIALIVFLATRDGGRRRGIAGIREPVQKPASGLVQKEIDGYQLYIEYKYSYEISALVVSTKDYGEFDIGDKLAPRDVALAWGRVAQVNGDIDFHWSQSGRWCYWKLDSEAELIQAGGRNVIGRCTSNNHLIAADDYIRKAIGTIKRGDYIRMKGYLVDVKGLNSEGRTFSWTSSFSRDDTGAHSCEVMYVTSIEWLD